jgi:hypothetical protein
MQKLMKKYKGYLIFCNQIWKPASNKFINISSKYMIFFGHNFTCIVGTQPYIYGIPHISPQGVVIVLFGKHGHTGHKGEGFAEVGEGKTAMKFVIGMLPHSA